MDVGSVSIVIQNSLIRFAAAAPSQAAPPPQPPPTAAPPDSVVPARPPSHPKSLSPGGVKRGAEAGLVLAMDIRVPTTTPLMSEERRNRILATVQPGDIILETDNAYPGWQRMEMLTLHSVHTHAAMYEGNGKFIEATTPDGVQRTDLKDYLDGRIMITLLRPDYKTPQDRDAALNYCRGELGKPYGAAFDLKDDNSQYCAGLVYKALQAMPNRIDVPLTHTMGRDAVGPDSFLRVAGATKVYDDGASFVRNQLSHWPVAAFAVGSAVAGAHFGGVLGGIGGFVGGLGFAICLGNKIQTGHFNLAGSGK